MAETNKSDEMTRGRFSWGRFVLAILAVSILTGLVAALLTNIFQRKQEAKNPYLRFVEVTEATTDPEPWGLNFPREYDQYKKTVIPTKTNFGGGDAVMTAEKAETFPFLTRMFAGYAFSLDYRDRRGHAFMLLDQEQTRRVTERPQPGACLHCHASVMPTYRRLGQEELAGQAGEKSDFDKVHAGFVKLGKMSYQKAHDELVKTGSLNPVWNGVKQEMVHVDGAHPVSCVDCHDPQTMRLRVTRPGFILGIKALKEHQGVKNFDANRDATRQEMRSYVCAQCHVEYYCGPKVTLFFPWNKGLKVEEMESYYDQLKFPDGQRFHDWTHAETGAEMLKAQHPEFELWNQGIHAKSGVSCADCHMPYQRVGAMKVSDHWVRSPLLMVNQSCQPCHAWPEEELKTRVLTIQNRNFQLLQQAGQSLLDMLDTVKLAREPFNKERQAEAEGEARAKLEKDAAFAALNEEGKKAKLAAETKNTLNQMWAGHVAKTPELKKMAELHRKAQWRLDFVAAENSMGFHASQEAARILGESIDHSRQAQLTALKMLPPELVAKAPVTTRPAAPTQLQQVPASQPAATNMKPVGM